VRDAVKRPLPDGVPTPGAFRARQSATAAGAAEAPAAEKGAE
jgi:hypothetical protein